MASVNMISTVRKRTICKQVVEEKKSAPKAKKINTTCCPICIEDRKNTLIVTCVKCSYQACRFCVKTYLLSQPNTQPMCMNCKAQWDTEFLSDNTEEKFHNNIYRDYTSKIILEREKSLLPATQPYVLDERKKIKLKEDMTTMLNENMLYRELLNINENRIAIIKRAIKRNDLSELIEFDNNTGESKESKKSDQKSKFTGKCPQANCKGYLGANYTCGLCEEKACGKCMCITHEGECDKDILETVKLLKKETRNCPNCQMGISKIGGCDQMWCTACHTPFSWKTGKIETGRTHNPHYYEWRRQNGGIPRENGDIPCGGDVSLTSLHNSLSKVRLDGKEEDYIWESHRLVEHLRNVSIPRYNRGAVINMDTNRDLRIKYLAGSCTEKHWLSEIKRREKKREKDRAIFQALTMLADTLNALHGNMTTCNIDDIPTYVIQLRNLNIYIRNVFEKMGKRFNNKVPIINSHWGFKDIGERDIEKIRERRIQRIQRTYPEIYI